MKMIALAVGLATSLAAPLFAGETLRLKLEPDHDYLLAGTPGEVVVKIDLFALDQKTKRKRPPLNLSVVLDRSGSMSGAKIEKARQAAMALVDRLGPEDLFSFVTYSDRAELVFPAQEVEDKDLLKRRISRIQPGGSTALYAGVQLGAEQVQKHLSSERINRVILLSDGLANVGPSSPRDLRRLGGAISERGIAVKDTEKLPEIFAKELGELLAIAAREVRIEILCPDGVRPIGFIGRPERFEGQRAAVRLSHLTVAQDRYVFLRCRVEEGQPEIARVKVSYRDELNGGVEQTISASAKVRFTEDRKLAANSLRPDVAAQKELLLVAVAKDEALADADAGRYQQAAKKLDEQANSLDYQYQNAPAPLQNQIREEIDNLRLHSNQLQKNQYNSSTRKSLQSESWTVRNSK